MSHYPHTINGTTFDYSDELRDKLTAANTLQNAREWKATQDKVVHCIDCLGISADHVLADELVDDLEELFAKRA